MAKYRIVARRGRFVDEMYFAQVGLFGFWVDLPFCSTGGYGNWPEGGETPSRQLHLVENYIGMYRDGFGKGAHFNKVIKEFD